MFQLRQLKTFLAAAETLSFTKAAERVHLSQPSVTEQVQALEQSVGQPLFIRTNNRLALTAAGERLVDRARELLAMADDTFREIRDHVNGQAGTIRIAAPQTLCTCVLVPLLAGHAELHPGSRVVIQETNSSATVQAVRDGTADLGMVHGWPVDTAGLQVDLLGHDTPVVVMPAGHPLGGVAGVTLAALAAHPLIATAEGCRYREHLDALLRQAPVRPGIRAVADSVPALVGMVSAGLGVAILPRMAVDTAVFAAAPVEVRPLAMAGGELPVCLITPARAAAARPVAAFAAMVRAAAFGSDQPVPPLDMEDGAGGVAAAHQEDDGVGDVVRGADPADRKLLRHRRQ